MVITSHAVELTFLISAASIAWSAAFAWARWLARPRELIPTSPEYQEYLASRVANVEQAINGMSVELQRLAEGQNFAARLLAERLPAPELGARTAVEPRRVNTPH
ncbi:MAG: hypothetical protein M3Z10_05685 [Gemmatimonadota bacterium]|nr:hypothetical protein [Gemmatimonadota bacterium]